MQHISTKLSSILATGFLALLFCLTSGAQTLDITYQGKLTDTGMPANGIYDLTFTLYDAPTGGSQIGPLNTRDNVPVSNGIFTVSLNFGSGPFTLGQGQYLEISVRPGNATGAYIPLSPRQPVTSSPYAIATLRAQTSAAADSAANADNANQLGGVIASQYVQTNDSRMTDARTPTAGSANYIQNTTSPQAASNFNISGTGSAGIIDVVSQYNIGGNRVLSTPGTDNFFAGRLAGHDNSTGTSNTFVGTSAGDVNLTGNNNAFFGYKAGATTPFVGNTGGSNNTAIGAGANFLGPNQNFSTVIGAGAFSDTNNSVTLGRSTDSVRIPGTLNVTSAFSSSFGGAAGFAGVVSAPTFDAATQYNIGGTRIMSNCCASNMFVGENAGAVNFGAQNSFFGSDSGKSNTSGNLNSFFGKGAGGSNTSASNNSFYGAAAGAANTTGFFNSFFGSTAGQNNGTGFHNSFFGGSAGQNNSSGSQNSFFGINAGTNNTVGSNNTFVGWGANPSTNNLNNATAIGASATVSQSNSLVLGSGVNVGIGTTAPLFKFHVRTGTDENLALRPASVFSGGLTGMGIQSVNDANSAYQPLDLEGSQVTLNVGSGGRVGIGTTGPPARLSVVGGGFAANAYFSDGNATATTLDMENTSSATSWRFQTNGNGDPNRSGNLEVWKVGGVNGLTIKPTGDVGLGTLTPSAKLDVNGIVQSSSGGFKFPDGTLQSTAASNTTYTNFRTNFVDLTSSLVTIAHLDLPAGTYLFQANIHGTNVVDSNFRRFNCSFTGVEAFQYFFTIPSDGSTVSMHMIATVPAVGVDLQCVAFSGDNTRLIQRRLTAVRLSGNVIVQ